MHPSIRILSATVLFSLAGCPSSAERPAVDADVSDTTLPSDVSVRIDSEVSCSGHDATGFPSYGRTCASDVDCTIAPHQTDCCGTTDALGIAASEGSRFAADEALCRSQYPACGCDSGTVMTDDGSSPPPGTGVSGVVVRCTASLCTTSARPSTPCDAATCGPTQVCVEECSGIDAGHPPSSHCIDVPAACAASADCACFGTDPCPVGDCGTVRHGAPVCTCG